MRSHELHILSDRQGRTCARLTRPDGSTTRPVPLTDQEAAAVRALVHSLAGYPEAGWDDGPPYEPDWQAYERGKAALLATPMSCGEYSDQIAMLAKRCGV